MLDAMVSYATNGNTIFDVCSLPWKTVSLIVLDITMRTDWRLTAFLDAALFS